MSWGKIDVNSELPDAEDSVSYDPETDTYRATYDNSNTTPTAAVIKMMATILERDPTEMSPLADVVDPEALDQFLMTRANGAHEGERRVEFSFQDHEVTVLRCGIIKVRPEASGE